MNYLRVRCYSQPPDMPVLIYSELDKDRFEIRKVEIFANGRMAFAPGGNDADTWLADMPLPATADLSRNSEFSATGIEAGDFDVVWRMALAQERWQF